METILNIFFAIFIIAVICSLLFILAVIALSGRAEREKIKIKCPYDKQECSAFGQYQVHDCTDCHRYVKPKESKEITKIIVTVVLIVAVAMMLNWAM